jgi:S1-C subfamily serine protease
MKFNYNLPALLIGVAVMLLPTQLALSLTQPEVDKIAREITVRVDGDGSGSGWIYDHKGDTYYVVTNHHVVAKDNGKYKIQTADGESHDAIEVL